MSLKLLLDENIPPRVAMELRQSGYDVVHVGDAGLRGCKDSELMSFARKNGRCLVTLDGDFSDLRHYPVGSPMLALFDKAQVCTLKHRCERPALFAARTC